LNVNEYFIQGHPTICGYGQTFIVNGYKSFTLDEVEVYLESIKEVTLLKNVWSPPWYKTYLASEAPSKDQSLGIYFLLKLTLNTHWVLLPRKKPMKRPLFLAMNCVDGLLGGQVDYLGLDAQESKNDKFFSSMAFRSVKTKIYVKRY